jgi:glutaredoxin 2
MTPAQRDQAYTHLCHTMTRVGEPQSQLFMARLALLAMERFESAEAAQAWIDAAADGMGVQAVAGSTAA